MAGCNAVLGCFKLERAWLLGSAFALVLCACAGAWAQTSTPSPTAPVADAPSSHSSSPNEGTTAAPAPPNAASPAPASAPAPSPSPAPALAPAPAPSSELNSDSAPASGDASNGRMLELPAKPALILAGTADWDDGLSTLMGAVKKIHSEIKRLNLTEDGRPMALFLSTDDQGFRFEAMVAVTSAPEANSALSGGIKLGKTPSGKVMRFEHHGSYDDIDSTYEAITAYLDEKGIDAQNRFVEEYMNDPKGSDDEDMTVNIYVFLNP